MISNNRVIVTKTGPRKVMAVGRKRKAGKRHPNGQLVRSRPIDYRAMAGEQPHRAWLPEKHRLSEKADTPLGGLNLLGVITDEQHEAGKRYAFHVGQYRAVIGTPTATAGGGRGYACNPDNCRVNPGHCECRHRKEKYDGAHESLFMNAGQKAARTVARVAVYAETCAGEAMADLRRGLDALAVHFGLSNERKRIHKSGRM